MPQVPDPFEHLTDKGHTAPELITSHVPAVAIDTRVTYLHESLADFILANPGASKKEMAAYVGKTPQWVGYVLSSDVFRQHLSRRRNEIVDPTILLSLQERWRALSAEAADILLETMVSTPSPAIALKVMEIAVKADANFINENSKAPVTHNTYVVALPSPAASEQAWAEKYQQPVIDIPAKVK